MEQDLLNPVVVYKGIEFLIDLYDFLKPNFGELVEAKDDRFLNYDPGFLLQTYAGEKVVANGITYTLVCDFSKLVPWDEDWRDEVVQISVNRKPFKRSNGKTIWQKTASAGFSELINSGRIKEDERTIRVTEASEQRGCLFVTLQKATYHDQGFSNLIMDFDRLNPGIYVSLRSQLETQFSGRLPSLKDSRLANTLGVAALLFYKNKGQWIPYIVRRVKKIGVFPGGLHCTSSGVAKWPPDPRESTFLNFATNHMLDEIDEEVGIKPEELIDFRPLALCREMARGGKPQLFYGGFTHLDRKALTERRKHARKVIKATNQWEEIERDKWLRSADVVLTPHRLSTRVGKWGLSLEGAAALHFGVQYARARLPHLNLDRQDEA